MSNLDRLYVQLLHFGFIFLQQAAAGRDQHWLEAQLEMLHNVPSLIGEPNGLRHQYYWQQERQAYIDWVAQTGHETAKSRMLTYFEPVWQEMEPLIAELAISRENTSAST